MAYVRETVKNQSIDLKFIASGANCADIFMKGLGKTKTQQHLARLSAMRWCQGLPSASQGGTIEWWTRTPKVLVPARLHRTHNFWCRTFMYLLFVRYNRQLLIPHIFCWLTSTCRGDVYTRCWTTSTINCNCKDIVADDGSGKEIVNSKFYLLNWTEIHKPSLININTVLHSYPTCFKYIDIYVVISTGIQCCVIFVSLLVNIYASDERLSSENFLQVVFSLTTPGSHLAKRGRRSNRSNTYR